MKVLSLAILVIFVVLVSHNGYCLPLENTDGSSHYLVKRAEKPAASSVTKDDKYKYGMGYGYPSMGYGYPSMGMGYPGYGYGYPGYGYGMQGMGMGYGGAFGGGYGGGFGGGYGNGMYGQG